MPHNLIKKYPELLEIIHLDENRRLVSLKGIFDRDITFNDSFKFRRKQIRPTKKDGVVSLETVFNHLIKEEVKVQREDNTFYKKRVFEKDRSERLHWVKPHIDELINVELKIFSTKERDQNKRKNVFRTYIFNKQEKYVIVLEPQRSGMDYYLLTAYYLNKPYGLKKMSKKMKKKLHEVL